jgi:glycosyltransferase involved in cell wall biosynthesis
MSVVTVTDLHTAPDPERRLAQHATIARACSGPARLIVRCPDRATTGVRTFRADDIARMLQQHGRILEIGITDAGTIVAAADLCRRRGEIAVWTGYAIGGWHPSDITQRGLGGSETAAVRLSEELAAMGYVVTLYGQFDQGGMCGDVMLQDFREFDSTRPLHALIGFRDARLFDERPDAEFTALWLEDLPGPEFLTRERAANIDRVCCVSRWHKGALEKHYPWLLEMTDPRGYEIVAACRNGITRSWFLSEPAPERETRVVYSSSPDRGGDILLECWPRIREQVPDAELILTYSRWYDIVAEAYKDAPGVAPFRRKLAELAQLPGVHRVKGGLGQKDLALLMRSSLVWAHPSWYTTGDMEFHETSCISAMEAQAAGLAVVASNWGSLTETVQHGTLIDGDPREPGGAWRRRFVDGIVRGLTDESVQAQAQLVGPEMVRDLAWRGAAEQLASMFPPDVHTAGGPLRHERYPVSRVAVIGAEQ